MNWMSLDIADGKTGAVVWKDNIPVTICRLEARNLKATKKLPERRTYTVVFRNLESGEEVPVTFPNERDAWAGVRNRLELSTLVIEAGHVHFPMAAMALAEARGRALTLLGAYNADPPEVVRVAPGTWRKGLRQHLSVDIPAKRDAAKKAAIEIARQLLGYKLTDDEAEAYLIGYWAWTADRVS